jgi:ribonuclease VapC
MVIDTSAVLAILFRESEADAFLAEIRSKASAAKSAWPSVNGSMTMESALISASRSWRAADPRRAISRTAASRYGKGRHPAALNLGDCCSYALAKATGDALLFKGGDFSRTDIPAA